MTKQVNDQGALQIQDRSLQSRPVASRNQSQMHSDVTGLHCGNLAIQVHLGLRASGNLPVSYVLTGNLPPINYR